MVGNIERDEFGLLGDARIAGGGVELRQHAARRQASRPAHARGRPEPMRRTFMPQAPRLMKPLTSGMAACTARVKPLPRLAHGNSRLDAPAARCHSTAMEQVQSKHAQGRVADAPSGHWVYRALPRAAVALCATGALGPADRLVAAAVAMLVVGGACGKRLCAARRQLCLAAAVAWHLVLFLLGAVAMRGAGCTYNDIVDADIDAKVERTRSRPLPSGQVTRRQAGSSSFCRRWSGLPCSCSSTALRSCSASPRWPSWRSIRS